MAVKAIVKTGVSQTPVSLVKAGVSGVNVVFTDAPPNLYLGGSDLAFSGGAVQHGGGIAAHAQLEVQLAASEELFCILSLGTSDVSVLTSFGSVV